MALDRRNYRALVETTGALATKAGAAEVVRRLVEDLKDDSEPYRRMVMETIDGVIGGLSAADIDARLEEQLIDGILYAFQEQASDDTEAMLSGFGVVVNALGLRTKPYLPQICGTIKWRLNNKSAEVRQQAADLISKCRRDEDVRGGTAHGPPRSSPLRVPRGGVPDVLGSILGALKGCGGRRDEWRTSPVKDLPRA